jgi:hypothetical protein
MLTGITVDAPEHTHKHKKTKIISVIEKTWHMTLAILLLLTKLGGRFSAGKEIRIRSFRNGQVETERVLFPLCAR